MVDVAYAPFLQFLPILDVEVPPNVQAYAQRLGERPSVAATRPADAPAAS
jgi:glutathione S-transferase